MRPARAPHPHAHHFQDLDRQVQAARFGMWLFLGTEVLLFGGLFVLYAFYRSIYPAVWAAASHRIDLSLGTINTVVLITSSFAVAAAIHFVRHDRRGAAVACLAFTIACALAFMGVKSLEYLHKFQEGALPGPYYHFEGLEVPGASLFFSLYFLMTGLHGVHVTVGMGVLAWLAVRVWQGRVSAAYDLPLELGGLYWHLVDIIWIFLYPLLYLV